MGPASLLLLGRITTAIVDINHGLVCKDIDSVGHGTHVYASVLNSDLRDDQGALVVVSASPGIGQASVLLGPPNINRILFHEKSLHFDKDNIIIKHKILKFWSERCISVLHFRPLGLTVFWAR